MVPREAVADAVEAVRVVFVDWTPLFRIARPAPDRPLPYEPPFVPDDLLDEFDRARDALERVAERLAKYDPEKS